MEKENENTNQNNPEQEFPDWMLVESDSDPMLLNMIQIREDIMTPIVEKGGFHALDPGDEESAKASMEIVKTAILDRKRELGLEPPAK